MQFTADETELLRKLVAQYGHFKELKNLSESLNDYSSFLPSMIDAYNAFDHLMRAFQINQEPTMTSNRNNELEFKTNLESSILHILRGNIELLEYILITLKEEYSTILDSAPSDADEKAFFEMYSSIYAELYKIENKVAQIRIMDYSYQLDEVDKNIEEITKSMRYLIGKREEILPKLSLYRLKARDKAKTNDRLTFVSALILTLTGVLVSLTIGFYTFDISYSIKLLIMTLLLIVIISIIFLYFSWKEGKLGRIR